MQWIGRASHCIDEASRAVPARANRPPRRRNLRGSIHAIADNAQETTCCCGSACSTCWCSTCSACAWRRRAVLSINYARRPTAAIYQPGRAPYFDDVVIVATGGYVLKSYEWFARIKQDKTLLRAAMCGKSHRLRFGTIVEDTMLKAETGGDARRGGSGRPARRPRWPHAR